ncbi:MAG TPA: prepilin-type N-terminal cleavage/methylation domain-containing protein [Polyangiaceae bacterium]|nr:prepilin-type N-terminal cleavage/methylation domain-containing protein [Polyangiaceae bacterium]
MRDTLRQEEGFTLIELLVASVLMIIVLGATLTALTSFERNTSVNEKQNEAQEQARSSLDRMARDLRNLASPSFELPLAVDRALPNDLIFQSEGKIKPAGSQNKQNTTRMRYCTPASGGLSRGLYRQTQTWTTAVAPQPPPATDCPGSGWTRTTEMSNAVTNGERAVFTYNSADVTAITEVSSQLFVDVNPGKAPAESDLQTSVYLRNQNRAPSATFTSAYDGSGGVVLNASESTDPEERPLSFKWYDETDTEIGDGIVITTPAAPGTHNYYLIVTDAKLKTQAPEQSVCVPGTGVTC